MKAKAFFSTRFRIAAMVLSGLLLLALYLGGLSASSASVHAQPPSQPLLSTPDPVVTLNVPDEVLLGEQFTFQVTFQNNGTTGFGPFIDLLLPAGGIDFAAPCDGITFGPGGSAVMVNTIPPLPLTTYSSPPADPCNSWPPTTGVPHEYAPSGVSPSGVVVPAGGQLVTLELPFGSYELTQPQIVVDVTVDVHEYADVGAPLTIYARGGFRYGDDAEDNQGSDPPILSDNWSTSAWWNNTSPPPTQDETRPTLFTLKKEYLGPENENATGPNFVGYYPLQYQITLDIAAGQTITDVVVTDTLPNNMAFLGMVGPVGTVPAPIPTTPTLPPVHSIGATLVWEFGTLTGTPVNPNPNPEVTILFEFYIPEFDANGDRILNPNNCNPVESINDVKATGLWDPLDPRDVGPVTVVSDITTQDHTLTDKCLAIQKSVTVENDTGAPGATPGDTLKYTLKFQVSDFFTFGDLAIDDQLSDGQLLITTPTLTVIDQFGTTSGMFTIGSDFLKTADPNLQCGIVQGGTHLEFFVSQAMHNLATFPPQNNGILTGGHALSSTTTTPATGEIVFHVQIQDEFDFPHPGDKFVDKHDPMNNCVTIEGEVFTNGSNPQPTSVIAEDDSETSISIVHDILSKEVYAVNGVINPSPPIQVAAGDDITFRLKMTIPSGDTENLVITDWLPQPVLDVAGTWSQGVSWSMIPGEWAFGSDTCHLLLPPTLPPTWPSVNPNQNSLAFNYGDFNDPSNVPCTIDILFTLTVTSDPYADGLLMTNEAQECEDNTFGQPFCQVAVVQFEVTQPVLKITKGVVATDNPKGEFVPSPPAPVTFTTPPDSTCARFTPLPTINSGNLPINSDIKFVDAHDWVTFAIVVENIGSGLHGAFDVKIKDILPPGLFGATNVCVTDGNGTSYTPVPGGSLFGPGIELVDPGPTTGALDPYHATNGNNLAVITFDAQISPTIQVGECLENEAELLHYAGAEGALDHVQAGFGGPYSDTAKVCILPLADKSIVTTSEAHTTPDDSASGTPKLAIGEIVRYRLWVKLPEGTLPGFNLIDSLPAGLSLIDPNQVNVSFTTDMAMLLSADLAGAENDTDPPTFVLPSGRISTVGQTTTFDLGNLVNNDNDDDWELLIIEFNALVENSSANNNGNSKSNQFTVQVDGQSVATSNSVNAQIVEPSLTISKDVITTTANIGGSMHYQITVQNTGTATAFDLQITDTLPVCLEDLQVSVNPSFHNNSTGTTLDVTVDELPVGDSIVIDISAELACATCEDLVNTVTTTYTSLPRAKGTVSNGTGSTTPGSSGAPDGERDGSDGTSGVNDYVASAEAVLCGEICGVKFHDENRNGAQEPSEPVLSNWTFEVRDTNGNVVGTATSDSNGEYCFEVLPQTYTLSEVQQYDWSQIYPPAPGSYTINLGPDEQLTGKDFGNATCTPPPLNMVAWWPLDEPSGPTAIDAAMFPNNGQHVGSPIPVGGMVDGALSFNGVNQYVKVPDHSEINFGTGDLSIDAWIRISSTNDYQVIVDKRGDIPTAIDPIGYEFLVYHGRLMFQLADKYGWSSYYNPNSPDLNDGKWHFVAVTVDRDQMTGGKLYVDDPLIPIHTFNPTKRQGSITNPAELWIGKHHPGGNYPHERWFDGEIDEVELFNRALTPTEVWKIWLANSDGKCKEPDLEIEKGHVGHFEIGGVGTYVINVTNVGFGSTNGPITVIDTLPPYTTYISGGGNSGWSCPLGPISAPGPVTCTYTGPSLPLAPGQTLPPLVINIRLNDLPEVENCATVEEVPHETNLTNNESCDVVEVLNNFSAPDLGDAPDSTNHYNTLMSAYWWWLWPPYGRYPTVYDPLTGSPSGPMHIQPEDDAFLGLAVSQEADADQTPNQNSNITNIDPPNNRANQDGYDDGVRLNTVNLPKCWFTRFEYDVNVTGAAGPRNLNVWFDFNQDGDWEDTAWCKLKWGPWSFWVPVREWAVQNQTVNLTTPGYHSNLNTWYFLAKRPTSWLGRWKGMWMRTTLTGQNDPKPWIDFGPYPADGRGAAGGYEYGETEDYRLRFPWWWVHAQPHLQVSTAFTQTNGLVGHLTIPAGAVTQPLTVTLSAVSADSVPSQRAISVASAFDIDVYQEGEDEPLPNFTFQRPVSITLPYFDREVADEESLTLLRYDEEQGDWVDAACGEVVHDRDANQLDVPICNTGEFALSSEPTTGVGISAPTITDGTAGSDVSLPITIDPYTSGLEIDAYEFTLIYDASVIDITGVSLAGTLSEEWTVTSDSTVPGQIAITADSTTSLPLGGQGGTLINLSATLSTTTDIASTLTFAEATFNDGDLPVISQPGYLINGTLPTISDVRTTNVRDVSFTVSWLTELPDSGEVRYGTDPNNLDQTAVDDRGAATEDDTHYVPVEGLLPDTTYYFDVVSAGTTDDNGGAHYTVTTAPTLGVASSDTIYGQVAEEDGSTLAVGTIVYITLEDADGAGSSGQAAALSALVDNSGYWSLNLGNARRADLSSYFLYSASGDELQLEAQGAADGVGCERVDTAADSPATDIVLNVSNCTITWPMSLQIGWTHISLPVDPITTPLTAEDVCDDINAQGGSAVEIDRWHNGGWDGHICGLAFNDFELVLGSDYFIKSSAASSWILEGYEVTEAVPLDLQVGWTSIGIPHTDAYTASSLCDDIISQAVTAVEIDRWYTGGWDGHICGLPFNDFNIERGTGYFVKTSSAGTVIPDAPATPLQQPAHAVPVQTVPVGQLMPVRELRVGNLSDSAVTLSWMTDKATTGYVLYGDENRELAQVALEVRGAAVADKTHYVTLTGLKPATSYDFQVVSGAPSDHDTLLTITTAPTLESLPASDTVYGQVYMADGVTPATSVLVYLTLQDADGTGDTGEATLLSALVDENGYWQANLGNARLAESGEAFTYSETGDEVVLTVPSGTAPPITTTLDTSDLRPATPLILEQQGTWLYLPLISNK